MADLFTLAHRIRLVPLIELSRDDQICILHIRNQRGVRDNMYTNHEIAEEEHFRWIEAIRTAQHTQLFAVFEGDDIIGGVSLNAINLANRRADWAFYLDERRQGRGLGAALEFKFLDYAFLEQGLQKLNCEVLAFNKAVIALHKRFGFQEEGVRRDHILRDGASIDVHLLGLTRQDWLDQREVILAGGKPGAHDASYYMSVIDDIERVRARNNKNWMDLLRLAFEKAPKETAAVVAEIYSHDREIALLAAKLVH